MFTDRKKLCLVSITAFLLLVGLVNPQIGLAQKKSSDSLYLQHSPKKATYLALIPGAGQIYNKKYWKLPIVYAGFGIIGYFVIANRNEYIKYHDAYICSVTLGDGCDNELAKKYGKDDLKTIRDYYRRNTELSIIVGVAWYGLQIVDAVVDAHLFYWNVNDDISLKMEPVINPVIMPQTNLPDGQPLMNGIKITVKF